MGSEEAQGPKWQESAKTDDLRRRARRRPRAGLLAGALLVALAALGEAAQNQRQFFEVQPEAQYMVANGADVRLRCLVRQRQGECLWLRNGRAVGSIARKYQFARTPDDGDCSIQIRNASVQLDDGAWQCQVTPPEVEQETLQSREVQLVVLVAPERPQVKNVSQGTQRLILEENKSRVVVCEIRGGNPAPQIEWLLDNKNVSKEAITSSNGNQSAKLSQSRLRLSDVRRTMNGKNLTCVGVHPTGNLSASVELDVQYVPTVSVVQREYSIVEGSPLSISCQVDANPPPNLVNWRLVSDGALASRSQPASQASGALTLPSRPGPVLEFERISRELNQNIFECLAQNAYGISLPADVKLNVLYAPYLLNTSNSESVQVGSQAQLACLFDGNPEPEVRWFYADPLSRSEKPVQLEVSKQQYLSISNVSYRNEGDYHCEARNQINGVYYGVRSSNIILDVFGEPQFLAKSPHLAKAVQGARSELALAFCSDPAPNKVYWQFGSLRLDVRLDNVNNGLQQQQRHQPQAPSGGGPQPSGKQMSQRFQAHPLQPLQKRDTSFSKAATCFEAQLSLLDPELSDQRDYTLVVQNERGHQSALVRLRVATPLSPVLMISSALVTICGLFLCSLLLMFLLKKRTARGQLSGGGGAGSGANPQAGANGLAGEKAASKEQQAEQQLTRGVVSGLGNGQANGAANLQAGKQLLVVDELAAGKLAAAAAPSDTSDHKQLLEGPASSSGSATERQSSLGAHSAATAPAASPLGRHASYHSGAAHSTASSSPAPLNHISVEGEEPVEFAGSPSYRAPTQLLEHNGLIYANLDYAGALDALGPYSPMPQQQQQRRQQTPGAHSPADSSLAGSLEADQRPSVGATIALMNSLAAQQLPAAGSSPGAGCLNGAISQQLASSRQARRPGPPKPPKPSIQQRSRFYSQQAAGLVMIGAQQDAYAHQEPNNQTGADLAAEYSRLAFPARAEL